MCLDMNDFYLGLVPEEERRRVEILEPFDEYEVSSLKRCGRFTMRQVPGPLSRQSVLVLMRVGSNAALR